MAVPQEDIDNPYWAEVQKLIADGKLRYMPDPHDAVLPASGHQNLIRNLQLKYSRVLADPRLLDWVLAACGQRIVEVDSQLGYWSYLLTQHGRDVVTYYARNVVAGLLGGQPKTYHPVHRIDGTRAALRASEYERSTLLAIESKKPDTIATALRAFTGGTFVLVGAAPLPGSKLHQILERDWQLRHGPMTPTGFSPFEDRGYFYRRKTGHRGVASAAGQQALREPTQAMPTLIAS